MYGGTSPPPQWHESDHTEFSLHPRMNEFERCSNMHDYMQGVLYTVEGVPSLLNVSPEMRPRSPYM
jgi:hypothetical protein